MTTRPPVTNLPDQAIFPRGFVAWVKRDLPGPGVMRTELESRSGQRCSRWFPFIKQAAAQLDCKADRQRDARDRRFTRFVAKGL